MPQQWANIIGKFFVEWKTCQLLSLEMSHCRHVQNILHYCGGRPRLIPTLTALKVNEMEIDSKMVGCLESPNVRQLSLKNASNTMGPIEWAVGRLYPFQQGILPNVINLSMQMKNREKRSWGNRHKIGLWNG